MVFNDTTTLNGFTQECEAWLFGSNFGTISGNTELLKQFTNLANYGLDQTDSLIFQTDGYWQHDDFNYTSTFPTATTNLSNGVNNYLLDRKQRKIHGFEVKDKDGNFYPLRKIDFRNIRQLRIAESEFFEEDGKPLYYDLQGNSVKLFPAPSTNDVTLTAGLRIIYQREPDYLVYTDTSKELGIPRGYHDVPVAFACAKYAKQNGMSEKARELDNEIQRRSQDIKNHFNTRNVEGKQRIKARYKSAI